MRINTTLILIFYPLQMILKRVYGKARFMVNLKKRIDK